jgi:hypothetical protein
MIEKPVSKEYLYALVGEQAALVSEAFLVRAGKKEMTQEQKDQWNKRKEFLHGEIRRVRALL